MSPKPSRLPEAEQLLLEVAEALKPRLTAASAMIGLHTGGAWLAERLHAQLRLKEPLGTMDISFYRDDYNKEGLKHDPKRTRIPFDVEGRDLLLVDDVLYTGRTVRAAMNELFDYGRPKSITLAVLVDRGGRQLPICAQVCGAQVEVPAGARLRLKRSAEGKLSLELETDDDAK
jgi:pyrimidine operon attenuation protein/uracil phosphoribosyltransferase